MRIVFIRQILPVLCFLGVAAGMTAAEGTGPQANVVAIVNGDVIRRVDLQREVRYLIQDLVHRGREVPGNPEVALGRQALDNLISRLLVYQASQEKGYRVEPYRVEEAVRSYRAGFPDEASYRRTLQRFMYTPESFRQHVERGLIVEKFHDEEIAPTVKITEEEIRRYYEEIRQYFVQVPARVHVRHILIEVPLGVSEADKAAALEKMRGGALRGAAAGGRRDRNPAAARAGDVWRAVVRGAHPVRHRGVAGVAAASRNFRTRRNFKTAPG